ncbi:hypothetical protein T492DRAFT_1062052 [Pavlovales sp. CCMP2436]|nr:hypothetical protein T492DRAFT_1062052 [Pavlovales sp. CCMP2436]
MFEIPGWCAHEGCDADEAARYWWVAPLWPREVSAGLELLCLVLVSGELALRLHYTGWQEFRREWWTSSRAAVVLVMAADIGVGALPWVLWRRTPLTRCLRIFVFLTQHHSLRVACMNIFRTVPALTEVLVVLLLVVLLFAWAATLLFSHIPETNFGSFQASLLEIYTLSTVTNFPLVTIPVFSRHPCAFLFFVLFLCVGVLLMMNLTLAIVYEAYRINLGREVQLQVQRQNRALRRAFDSLAVPVDPLLLLLAGFGAPSAPLGPGSRTCLDHSSRTDLLAAPRSPVRSPGVSPARGPRGSVEADRSGSGLGLGAKPRSRPASHGSLADSAFLQLPPQPQHTPHSGRARGSPPRSASVRPSGAAFAAATRTLQPRGVRLGAWTAMLRELAPGLERWQLEMLFHGCDTDGAGFLDVGAFNNVLSALQLRFEPVRDKPAHACDFENGWREELRTLLTSERTERAFDALALVTAVVVAWPERSVALVLHIVLVGAFFVEMVLKLVMLGPAAYCNSGRTRLDGLVVLVAVGALTFNLAELHSSQGKGEAAVRHTLHQLRAPVFTFLGVLFCFLYASATVGIEVFGGLSYKGAECLQGSEYARQGYGPINFNSLPAALALAFVLLMVNDFGIFMNATAGCSSAWARGYFVLFHLCNVVIVSNLLTSFILEATLRAWADVDAESAVGANGMPPPSATRPNLSTKRSGGSAAASTTNFSAGGGCSQPGAPPSLHDVATFDPFATAALVLDQRAAYLHRMQMRVDADRITLDDGRVFAIQRVDSFTGLAAMEELFDAPNK